MKVTYVGPHDAVDVLGVGTVAQGKSVEVSAEIGKSLLKQADNWQPATAKKGA
jgi:hypothetical protein